MSKINFIDVYIEKQIKKIKDLKKEELNDICEDNVFEYSAFIGDLEAVKTLLSVNLKKINSATMFALSLKRNDVVKFLLNYCDEATQRKILLSSIISNNKSIFEYTLDNFNIYNFNIAKKEIKNITDKQIDIFDVYLNKEIINKNDINLIINFYITKQNKIVKKFIEYHGFETIKEYIENNCLNDKSNINYFFKHIILFTDKEMAKNVFTVKNIVPFLTTIIQPIMQNNQYFENNVISYYKEINDLNFILNFFEKNEIKTIMDKLNILNYQKIIEKVPIFYRIFEENQINKTIENKNMENINNDKNNDVSNIKNKYDLNQTNYLIGTDELIKKESSKKRI
jgi:hypothetical protein